MTEILTNIGEILNSIQRNLKSPKDLKNNFGNFAYRNAEGILHAFKEEIEKEIYPRNIRIITDFGIELIGNRTFMRCQASIKMADASEYAYAYAELDVTKKGMDQAQLTGAATSYAKKYALCNLLAIDDSKSDPDSDEKPKEDKKPEAKKNSFGIDPEGGLAKGDDMKDMLEQVNKDSVVRLIVAIKKKKSLAEFDIWLENKDVVKELNKLEKYHKAGFDSVMNAIEEFKYMNKDDSAALDNIGR